MWHYWVGYHNWAFLACWDQQCGVFTNSFESVQCVICWDVSNDVGFSSALARMQEWLWACMCTRGFIMEGDGYEWLLMHATYVCLWLHLHVQEVETLWLLLTCWPHETQHIKLLIRLRALPYKWASTLNGCNRLFHTNGQAPWMGVVGSSIQMGKHPEWVLAWIQSRKKTHMHTSLPQLASLAHLRSLGRNLSSPS